MTLHALASAQPLLAALPPQAWAPLVTAGVAAVAASFYAVQLRSQLGRMRSEFKKLRGDFTHANERAAGSRGEKTQLMRIALHTVAMPLREVAQDVSTLAAAPDIPPAHAETVARLQAAMARVDEALKGLEELQALEARSRSVTAIPLNVGAVLHEAVLKVQPHAEHKGVRLSLPDPSKTSMGRGDAEVLRRVLENLIVDAVEVTPRGGTVSISIYQTSDRVLITVSDEGPGAAVDDQAALLDHSGNSRPPFHHLGARLNLAMVHNLIKAMDGWLWSQGEPGRGTTQVVELALPDSKAARS
jgi:hypothetical protein